jgi:succinate-semialdehyde dehydrogenase / glutarate-semialdehyde dehydrogenase
MKSVNPATGVVLAEYPEITPAETRDAIEACRQAFGHWSVRPLAERAAPMLELARLLRSERDRLAALETAEMGKVIRESRGEVEKCAFGCEHYARQAGSYLASELVATEAAVSRVVYAPLGVIFAVMPWNFPYWQVFRFLAPALMAGNGALLKHASNVTGCGLAAEDLVRRAGFPDGLFRALPLPSSRVAEVIADPRVAGVTLTGSEAAGSAVAVAAGRHLKKVVLELGGSDAYVVLEDADLALATKACVAGRMLNGGQSCIAAKRFVVVQSVLPAFERLVVEAMAAVRPGDPLDESSGIGPLARPDLRDEVHDQVTRSVAAGARLLLGGVVPAGKGAYYPPTVLGGVRPGMPAFEEEVFGPVASIVAARDEEDAIRLANQSRFGLGAAVFTRDAAKGERIAAERLEAGACFVNAYVRSDPRLPFGGTKASGYGRELGAQGIREWTNVKTVYVA